MNSQNKSTFLQISYMIPATLYLCHKGINGKELVAIAGGNVDGIAVWNPADGSTKTHNSTFLG
jgi:hypothetical protein